MIHALDSGLSARVSQSLGNPRVRPWPSWSLLVAVLLVFGLGTAAEAQVIRGRVVGSGTRSLITEATVDALDSLNQLVRSVRSDSMGRFLLTLDRPGVYRLRVRRIGVQQTVSDPFAVIGRDTMDADVLVEERAAQVDEVSVTANRLNAQRLAEAQAKGWRVVPPERVARAKQAAQQMEQMLRGLSLGSVMIERDCVRSRVSLGCLTIFVDDQYFGQRGMNMINPKDIEFMVIIGPADAVATYGNRAQYGVLLLYTSRYEDIRARELEQRRPQD